jgi:hypothetical protein
MKTKILKIFGSINKDKLLHFFYGSIISFLSIVIFGINGLWINVVIAAAKEIVYDGLMKKGTVDFYDFIFTCIPSLMYLILYNGTK